MYRVNLLGDDVPILYIVKRIRHARAIFYVFIFFSLIGDLPSIYIVHTAWITTLLYVYMHTYDYTYMHIRILL